MYAYALEECGAYADAERWGRQAVERNPGDLWAIHSVAHVLEMQGRSAEGVKWLDYTPQQWADKNPFKAHVWWHAALFFLGQGDYDRALDLYDRALCSVNSETYIDVSNQAALLKRLQFSGVDIGDRWDALAGHAQTAHPRSHAAVSRRALLSCIGGARRFRHCPPPPPVDDGFCETERRLARGGDQKCLDPAVRRHPRLRAGPL